MRFYHVILLLSGIFLFVGCSDNYLIISGNSTTNFSGGNTTIINNYNDSFWIPDGIGGIQSLNHTSVQCEAPPCFQSDGVYITGNSGFTGNVTFGGMLIGTTIGAIGGQFNKKFIFDQGINVNGNRGVNASKVCDYSDTLAPCLHQTQYRVNGSCAAGSSIRAINSSGGVTCETDTEGSDSYVTGISITEAGSVQNISLSRNNGLPTLWATFNDNNTGTSGGTTYNQNLNYTENVTFNRVIVNNSYMHYNLYEQDFLTSSASVFDPFLGAAVSSGTIVATTGLLNNPGIVGLRDSTTANGGYQIGTDTNALILQGNMNAYFIFQDTTTKTTTTARFGWLDTKSITAPTDGCWFHLANHILKGICGNSTNQVNTTTYTIPSRTRYYKALININPSYTNVTFRLINSTTQLLVWNQTITNKVSFPGPARDTGFFVQAFENSVDAAATIINFDYMAFDIRRKLVR